MKQDFEESEKQKELNMTKVAVYLLVHRKITSWDAIRILKISRLSEYISRLREKGVEIEMTRIYPDSGNWYVLYTIK